jgi:hypothetical protein
MVGALLAGLAVAAMAGCAKEASTATPPDPTTTTAAAQPAAQPSPTPADPAPGSTPCALMIKIATDSGLMVNKHYISPLKETLDQLKAAINASLPVRDQLLTGLPPDVRAAAEVQFSYFQALKDHDFATDTPVPAGLAEATRTFNAYQVATCGVTFDK